MESDRRSDGVLLRRRDGSFPFTSIGASSLAADFFEAFAMKSSITYPFKAFMGMLRRMPRTAISTTPS
jgi:hypothetical protein